MPDPAPTYWDYLRLPQLLSLQGGLEGDEQSLLPDELHFIIVHQAYELWFKLLLRELRLARDHLAGPRVPEEMVPLVVHHLRRVSTVLELLVAQFKVMETLTPQDFLAFRDKLSPASGFQSVQMRELEILLGLEESQRERYGTQSALEHLRAMAKGSAGGPFILERLEVAANETTIRQALRTWLSRTPIQGSSPGQTGDDLVVQGFLDDYLRHVEAHQQELADRTAAAIGDSDAFRKRIEASLESTRQFLHAADVAEADRPAERRLRAALVFIESYRELPLLAWPRLLLDQIVEVEEQLVLFRARHARMVERTIGRRTGTGGSSGVDYLDRTAQTRIFSELWSVRTVLLPKSRLPPLVNEAFYGFAR